MTSPRSTTPPDTPYSDPGWLTQSFPPSVLRATAGRSKSDSPRVSFITLPIPLRSETPSSVEVIPETPPTPATPPPSLASNRVASQVSSGPARPPSTISSLNSPSMRASPLIQSKLVHSPADPSPATPSPHEGTIGKRMEVSASADTQKATPHAPTPASVSQRTPQQQQQQQQQTSKPTHKHGSPGLPPRSAPALSTATPSASPSAHSKSRATEQGPSRDPRLQLREYQQPQAKQQLTQQRPTVCHASKAQPPRLGKEIMAIIIACSTTKVDDTDLLALPREDRKKALCNMYDAIKPWLVLSRATSDLAHQSLWKHLFFRRPMSSDDMTRFCLSTAVRTRPSRSPRFVHLDICSAIAHTSSVAVLPGLELIKLPPASASLNLGWLPFFLPRLKKLANISAALDASPSAYIESVARLIARSHSLASISVSDGAFVKDPKLSQVFLDALAIHKWANDPNEIKAAGEAKSIEEFEWVSNAPFAASIVGKQPGLASALHTLKVVQSNPPIMEKADHATPSLNDLFRGASLRHLTLYMSYGQCGMLDDILKTCPSLTHLATWTTFVTGAFFRSICLDPRSLSTLELRHSSSQSPAPALANGGGDATLAIQSTSHIDAPHLAFSLLARSAAEVKYVAATVVRYEDYADLKWEAQGRAVRLMMINMAVALETSRAKDGRP